MKLLPHTQNEATLSKPSLKLCLEKKIYFEAKERLANSCSEADLVSKCRRGLACSLAQQAKDPDAQGYSAVFDPKTSRSIRMATAFGTWVQIILFYRRKAGFIGGLAPS